MCLQRLLALRLYGCKKLWVFLLQFAACPAHALKARQTKLLMAQKYSGKRHSSCIFLPPTIMAGEARNSLILMTIFTLHPRIRNVIFSAAWRMAGFTFISGIRTVRTVVFLMVFIAAHATAHAHHAASPFYRAVDCTASGTLTGSVRSISPLRLQGYCSSSPSNSCRRPYSTNRHKGSGLSGDAR